MTRHLTAAVALLLLSAWTASAQASLSRARDLYSAAAYEEALVLLDDLEGRRPPTDDIRLIEQYRGFALLALGRTTDAERAFAAIVAADPSYIVPANEASPRVRAVFDQVRRRTLPLVAKHVYGSAKDAFNRKDFARAATLFDDVIPLLEDPALANGEDHTELAEYRTLAAEYRELSRRLIPPPPPPIEAMAVGRDAIYDGTVLDVTPPVVVRQSLPAMPERVAGAAQGLMEIVIDETGKVESAVMRTPVHHVYDPLALNAARSWTYKAATRNGVPVKYRKLVQITVRP
jgi:tetratricopeptide (TPR) repeat protein